MDHSSSSRLFGWKIVTTSLAIAFASYADESSATNLPKVPGLTEIQQSVANVIDTVCPNINKVPNKTPGQQLLTSSCNALVVTANSVLRPTNPDPVEPLQQSLQSVAPVQMNAQSSLTTVTSRNNLIAARLFDLRGGARGFSISMDGTDAPAVAAATTDKPHDATGGAASADFGGGLGGFVKFAGNWGNVDRTDLQDPYKYDAFSVLAGADYRVNDALVVGGAVGYEDTRSRFDDSLGKVDAQTWSFAGYATYTVDKWYVDGSLSYSGVDYDTKRTILIPTATSTLTPPKIGSATASPNGDLWSASIGAGYNYDMNGYSLVPFGRLGYIHVRNKAFSEQDDITGMNLAVDARTLESLQTALGATISRTINSAMGVFTPYFTAQWVHEFKNDNPSISAKFVNDPLNKQFFIPTADPTRDFGVFIVGSSATFANGFSGFLQVGAAAGLRDATNYSVVAGLRKEF